MVKDIFFGKKDEFDQLIEAEGETMTYDALGRRIQKGQTAFLYIGHEEIGAFEQNKPKELKILGIKTPPTRAARLSAVEEAPLSGADALKRERCTILYQSSG